MAGKWPLAAKAGVDSHALDKVVPPGGVNQGPLRLQDLEARPQHRLSRRARRIWNPVKVKMMQGGKVTSVTVPAYATPGELLRGGQFRRGLSSGPRCSTAPATGTTVHEDVERLPACQGGSGRAHSPTPTRWTNSMPVDRRRAGAGGADRAVGMKKPRKRVKWAYFPRWADAARAAAALHSGAVCRAAIATRINDNLVLILMIETLDGFKDADKIAKLPGVTAPVRRQRRSGQFRRLRPRGDPDYEREINIVHDATIKAHIKLWGPTPGSAEPDSPDFRDLAVRKPAIWKGPMANIRPIS